MNPEAVILLVVGALIVGGWFGIFCERIHAGIRASRAPRRYITGRIYATEDRVLMSVSND